MTRASILVAAAVVLAPAALAQRSGQAAAPKPPASGFTLEQVKGLPYPDALTAAATGRKLAWEFNERGVRNVWVAEGPGFTARRLTDYTRDDGQELTSIAVSADGKWVVYVRGGDHGSNWEGPPPNPGSLPVPPKVQLWSVPFAGGTPKLLAEGDAPVISPRSDVVAFTSGNQISLVPVDGSAPARKIIAGAGELEDVQWSPDGSRLAFVSNRTDHAFIGVYSDDTTPITLIAPTTSRDESPRWSPDGKQLVFVRQPGTGGPPPPVLERRPRPWALWTADAATGAGRELWKSPATLRGSPPGTDGGTNLHWAAGGRIVFLSYMDGWPHLYSIPAAGGEPLLLTPGNYMAEYITLSPDGKFLVFAGNAGTDADDIDRRHVVKAPVDRAAAEVLTPGTGVEWTPVVLGDGTIAYLGATAQRPPLPMVLAASGKPLTIGADRVPADFPAAQLVTPKKVVFKSSDGLDVHGQLFETPGGPARKPAVIFVHGGPPRQMLLGWHYMYYYSNAYAVNQYLASRGFVVLSVNYRLGIGYGFDFHRPEHAGPQGASEYLDVKAGAEWLKAQPEVDGSRIGIWGGSYGGFLTAMALARNSDLFATGVDIHGVHDWLGDEGRGYFARTGYEEPPDKQQALDLAWKSGPDAYIDTWKSPVLLIQGDDDRNVRFHQTVDLARRLAAKGVDYEELVLPDEIHDFLRYASVARVDSATAEWLERKLMGAKAAAARATPRSR